jgi:hypothetical protein
MAGLVPDCRCRATYQAAKGAGDEDQPVEVVALVVNQLLTRLGVVARGPSP